MPQNKPTGSGIRPPRPAGDSIPRGWLDMMPTVIFGDRIGRGMRRQTTVQLLLLRSGRT